MDRCCTCENCCASIEKTLAILNGKWSFLILWNIYDGTKRFSQLQKLLLGISPKTLSLRLHELEKNGVITKTIYPEIPPRVEYSMTEKGNKLKDVFAALIEWDKVISL